MLFVPMYSVYFRDLQNCTVYVKLFVANFRIPMYFGRNCQNIPVALSRNLITSQFDVLLCVWLVSISEFYRTYVATRWPLWKVFCVLLVEWLYLLQRVTISVSANVTRIGIAMFMYKECKSIDTHLDEDSSPSHLYFVTHWSITT